MFAVGVGVAAAFVFWINPMPSASPMTALTGLFDRRTRSFSFARLRITNLTRTVTCFSTSQAVRSERSAVCHVSRCSLQTVAVPSNVWKLNRRFAKNPVAPFFVVTVKIERSDSFPSGPYVSF